jgi:hypothetical protein
MRYLYGDSTAFPLNQNFIETAAAATDTAVALLRVDELLARSRKVGDDANVAAMKELADIDQLWQRVESSLATRDHLSNATSKVAEQVMQAAKAQFDRARQGVRSWRDATMRKATQGTGPAALMEPLHRFIVRQELPYTSWGLRWRAGGGSEPVQAQVYAIMQRGLTATVAVAIPPRHLWAEPVKVQELEKGLTIKLAGKNWLGHDKMLHEQLDRYYVTRVTRTTEREMLALSKKPSEGSQGLRISLREGDNRRVTITRVDEADQPLGEPVALSGHDSEVVRRLWAHVKTTIGSLVPCRSHLLAATLYGKPVHELDTPAPIAVAIIQAVAPLVRDMQRHSRTAGELQLKRDLGDGRREELFISHAEMVRKWQTLSARNQQLFDMYGLTRADATESLPASQPPMSLAPMSQAPMSMSMAPSSRPALSQAPASLSQAPISQRGLSEGRISQRGELDGQRREAVRRAAEAVRRAARQGSSMRPPASQPGHQLSAQIPAQLPMADTLDSFELHTADSIAPAGRSAPPVSMQVPAASAPAAVPRAPRVPHDMQPDKQRGVTIPRPSAPPRRRANTPSPEPLSPEAAEAENGQLFQLPAPSAPPRRASSRPNLRVVNGG